MCSNLAHIIVIISRIVLSLQQQHLLSVFLFLFAIISFACFYFIWELRSSPSFFARLVKKNIYIFFIFHFAQFQGETIAVWLSAAVTTALCRRSAKFAPAWSWFFFFFFLLVSSQLMQSYMGRINHVDKDWLFCIKKEGKKTNAFLSAAGLMQRIIINAACGER